MKSYDDVVACVSDTMGECFGEDKILFCNRDPEINMSVILNPSLSTNIHYLKIFDNSFIPDSNRCCRISLTRPEYIHVDESELKAEFRLDKNQKKILVEEMKNPFCSMGMLMFTPIRTNWEYMIYEYNLIRRSNNKKLELLSMSTPMPDYLVLPD